MVGENCRKNISTELEKISGVNRVNIRLPESIVEVEFDEKVITLPEIKKIIQEFGYDPL
jgi:copper chaperone CopZ